MVLSDALALITDTTLNPDYVPNSLIVKSYDDNGATYKWLEKINDELAERHERFFAFEAGQSSTALVDRTILTEGTLATPVIYDIAPAK